MALNKNAADHVYLMATEYSIEGGDEAFLSGVLRYTSKWRSQLISNTLLRQDGVVVQSGLFKGMAYGVSATEGALAARLLGTYESELHPHVLKVLSQKPSLIVDIGCAEGYYAVGLARLAPWARIQAFDISALARERCAQLAARNQVSERVAVGGELTAEGLEALASQGAFIFCDIEGAEADLLDPARTPSLARCSLIVETHPSIKPGVTQLLKERFAATHAIEEVRETVKDAPPGHWLMTLPLQDRFIATWEWRSQPTPWLVMTPLSQDA
jgi:hypothetical protein